MATSALYGGTNRATTKNSHRVVFTLLACAWLTACSGLSYTNKPAPNPAPPAGATPASFDLSRELQRPGNNHDLLLILALSGGGSRAAYLSAGVMFKLQQTFQAQGLDLLQQVDLLSSVSGGSLTAGYYLISADPGQPAAASGRRWDEQKVKKLLARNYINRWIGNWFWPVNIARFWLTDFDRSDIMAQTFADNLFDVAPLSGKVIDSGRDLLFADANPRRPNVILNATTGTQGDFGRAFSFTDEGFAEINSDIQSYEVARAVMASATFPAVFNYMTLRNHSEDAPSHTHLFDGGNSDNLGLDSARRAIQSNDSKRVYKKIVVVLVDAYTGTKGVSPQRSDGRRSLSYLVDTNFLDSMDSLLRRNRQRSIIEMRRFLNQDQYIGRSTFWHITFDAIQNPALKQKLRSIPTNFKISSESLSWLDEAVSELVDRDNACLGLVRSFAEQAQTPLPARPSDPCWQISAIAEL